MPPRLQLHLPNACRSTPAAVGSLRKTFFGDRQLPSLPLPPHRLPTLRLPPLQPRPIRPWPSPGCAGARDSCCRGWSRCDGYDLLSNGFFERQPHGNAPQVAVIYDLSRQPPSRLSGDVESVSGFRSRYANRAGDTTNGRAGVDDWPTLPRRPLLHTERRGSRPCKPNRTSGADFPIRSRPT